MVHLCRDLGQCHDLGLMSDCGFLDLTGDECYLACDKGQINPLHVLVLPIEHQASTLAMAPSAFAEMERYLSALRSCFASQVQLSLLSFSS